MSTDHPLFGKKFLYNGRLVTIGESYEGHGPDDPSGYYYTFDEQPRVTHWITPSAMSVRFQPVEEK